jgi:hypothetical protein
MNIIAISLFRKVLIIVDLKFKVDLNEIKKYFKLITKVKKVLLYIYSQMDVFRFRNVLNLDSKRKNEQLHLKISSRVITH